MDKQPGVRPVGIGEVPIRFIGKVVMKNLKRDILKATQSLQFCAGQDLSSEAAIHTVYEMFNKENTGSIHTVYEMFSKENTGSIHAVYEMFNDENRQYLCRL